MNCNVGGIERPIRIVVGVILLLAGFLAGLPTWGAAVAYVVGGVALVTGAVQLCPLWWVLGINTCPRKASEKT